MDLITIVNSLSDRLQEMRNQILQLPSGRSPQKAKSQHPKSYQKGVRTTTDPHRALLKEIRSIRKEVDDLDRCLSNDLYSGEEETEEGDDAEQAVDGHTELSEQAQGTEEGGNAEQAIDGYTELAEETAQSVETVKTVDGYTCTMEDLGSNISTTLGKFASTKDVQERGFGIVTVTNAPELNLEKFKLSRNSWQRSLYYDSPSDGSIRVLSRATGNVNIPDFKPLAASPRPSQDQLRDIVEDHIKNPPTGDLPYFVGPASGTTFSTCINSVSRWE
jgi:hypothetical protein